MDSSADHSRLEFKRPAQPPGNDGPSQTKNAIFVACLLSKAPFQLHSIFWTVRGLGILFSTNNRNASRRAFLEQGAKTAKASPKRNSNVIGAYTLRLVVLTVVNCPLSGDNVNSAEILEHWGACFHYLNRVA
jgi:hypothetical protein